MKGYFDVAFDDGTFEKKVYRNRIQLDPKYNKHAFLSKELSQCILRPPFAAQVKRKLIRKRELKRRMRDKLAVFNPAFKVRVASGW